MFKRPGARPAADVLASDEPSPSPSPRRRKTAGGTLTRSEVTGVRLDPKLKYLAELAARKQRRTLSSFIEWAIEDALRRFLLDEPTSYNDSGISFVDAAGHLWDVVEADRFAKLALRYPELLTYEEQLVWKLVRENGYLWRGKYRLGKWTWDVEEESLIFERLRENWELFTAVARGEADASVLPTWVKEKAEPKPEPKDDLDDDIPF